MNGVKNTYILKYKGGDNIKHMVSVPIKKPTHWGLDNLSHVILDLE